MTTRLLQTLLLLAFVAGPAHAQDAAKTRVLALLSAIHELPARSDFDAAAPNARDIVLAVARDATVTGPHRTRALEALRYWPDDAAFAAYRLALETKAARHKTLRMLGATFGARALPVLTPYLRHADPQLRVTALEAVADVEGSAADALLSQALVVEAVPWVKRRLHRARARQGRTVK